MQSVIHIVDYPMLPNDEAIEEAFPNIEIRSSNSVEEGDDHDHDHDDDDHNDAAGASSAASYLKHTVVAVVSICPENPVSLPSYSEMKNRDAQHPLFCCFAGNGRCLYFLKLVVAVKGKKSICLELKKK